MAGRAAVPDWIEIRPGTAPLLLFAPHAGRRTTPRRPGRDKVNDLHTGDVTRALGAASAATCIINRERDRNDGDLNRVEQVQLNAPWLLDLLADTLDAMIARTGGAVLLAIHGWNVVQPVCDVGVGLVDDPSGVCRPAARGKATVSDAFLASHLRRLQRLAARARTVVTIGVRYPAAHPSNMMQLFTPARTDDADPRIARLARMAAHVEAAQLELGIPLRWPGRRRAAFLDTLVQVFGAGGVAAAHAVDGQDCDGDDGTARTRRAFVCGGRSTTRVGLQLADDRVAVLTSIDVAPSGPVAGRLLVTDAANRLALFTGELTERRTAALHVPALRLVPRAGHGFDVRFAGPLLSFPMLTPFRDLERGLAAGTLLDARVELRFTPTRPDAELRNGAARFGLVEGSVRLGDVRARISARAHATEGYAGGDRPPSAHLVLPASPLGDLDLRSTVPAGAPAAFDTPAAGAPLDDIRFAVHGTAERDGAAVAVRGVADLRLASRPAAVLRLESDGGATATVEGAVERVIPVRRPGHAGTVVETFYALLRPPGACPGWIEITVEHPAER